MICSRCDRIVPVVSRNQKSALIRQQPNQIRYGAVEGFQRSCKPVCVVAVAEFLVEFNQIHPDEGPLPARLKPSHLLKGFVDSFCVGTGLERFVKPDAIEQIRNLADGKGENTVGLERLLYSPGWR